MSWWKNLWSRPASAAAPLVPEALRELHFSLHEWNEEEPRDGMRIWSGPDHRVLVADFSPEQWGSLSQVELRQKARALAENSGGGLVEVFPLTCPAGTAVQLIYKRLQMPAYIYTGMFLVPAAGGSVVWTVVAGECRMTGIRESMVTSELMNAGKLTLESYQRDWAQDPYDKSYHGVEQKVLHFLSDEPQFDSQFPDHPLSKVRHVLAELARQAQAVRQVGVSAAA